MAKFYNNIDLLRNKLQNAGLENVTLEIVDNPTTVANPINGQIVFTATGHAQIYFATTQKWIDLNNFIQAVDTTHFTVDSTGKLILNTEAIKTIADTQIAAATIEQSQVNGLTAALADKASVGTVTALEENLGNQIAGVKATADSAVQDVLVGATSAKGTGQKVTLDSAAFNIVDGKITINASAAGLQSVTAQAGTGEAVSLVDGTAAAIKLSDEFAIDSVSKQISVNAIGVAKVIGAATSQSVTDLSGKVTALEGTVTDIQAAEENRLTNITWDGTALDRVTDAAGGYKVEIKEKVDEAIAASISSVYKPAGSSTFANLPEPAKALLGNVYNVTDAFTTDAKFIEGAGQKYPAGTNVVVIKDGADYKYDVLGSTIDLSNYYTKNEVDTKITGMAKKAVVTVTGDGTANTIAVAHNLATADVEVATYVGNDRVFIDHTVTDANTVTLQFATNALANGTFKVVVVG